MCAVRKIISLSSDLAFKSGTFLFRDGLYIPGTDKSLKQPFTGIKMYFQPVFLRHQRVDNVPGRNIHNIMI